MSACGRDDDDDDQLQPSLVAKKPGVVTAATASATTSATSTCCSTKNSGGSGDECTSGGCTTAGGSCTSTTSAQAGGVVPPRRLADAPRVRRTPPPCAKCKTPGVRAQVQVREHAMCATCFTALMVVKVKAALRLRVHIGKGARVLLGVSGGASSSCLAHIMRLCCDPASAKRLFFTFDLVHIDEGAVAPGVTEQENEQYERQVRELYAGYGARYIHVRLEEIMNLGTEFEAPGRTQPTAANPAAASAFDYSTTLSTANHAANRAALQSLFAGLKDSSDKADLLALMRTRLLAHVARTHGYAQVVLGHNCTHTAIEIFNDTAKGRGACVPLSAMYEEHGRFQCSFLYPAREQTNAHMAYYNHFERIHPVVRYTFTSASKKSAVTGAIGINKLTHDFVCMLDAKYASTVYNIVSTVAKLAPPHEYHAHAASIVPLQAHPANQRATGPGGASAAAAATSTATVGTVPLAPMTPTSHCALCGRARVHAESEENARTQHAGTEPRKSHHIMDEQSSAILAGITACYGCESILRGLADTTRLPAYIQRGAFADHRRVIEPTDAVAAAAPPATSSSAFSSSAYPPPFHAFLAHAERGANLSHAERVEANRRKKVAQAQAKASESIDDAATDEATTSTTTAAAEAGSTRLEHPHGLQKQSREDMRASFAEFVLTDE